jgi:hypothetical protein
MDNVGKDILTGSAFLVAGAAVFVGGMIGAAEMAQSLSQTFGAVAALGSYGAAAYLFNKGVCYCHAGPPKWLKESSATIGKPIPEMR